MVVGLRDEHDLRAIGEMIRLAIERDPIAFGDANTAALTVSVGGALADTDTTPAELIGRADLALYAASGAAATRCGSAAT